MASQDRARAGLAIRWRLTIWIALAFAVSLIAVFASIYIAVTEILEDDVRDDLTSTFEQARGVVLVRGSDQAALQSTVADYPYPVIYYDATGVLIAANAEADVRTMRLTESEVVRVTIEGERFDESMEIAGEQHLVRTGRLRAGDEVLIIQVAQSTQAVEDVRQVLATILIAGGAIAVLLVFAVGFWLARSALRPVERVTRVAAEIEASDLTRRLSARGEPREVQRLAETFDAMLARLESAFSQQRNFVMDVSHELRSPLTGLRGNLDVMLMDPKLDADTRAQLEKVSAEVGRLIRLTSNLLYLAHAEAGREIARQPVELDALCLEVVHQSRNVREDVRLRLGHEEQVNVSGDRDLLKQLLLNLVDNAIKYSPSGGEVVISVEPSSSAVEVIITDEGPGIPREQLELIFERFYRGTNSPERTVGGAGIGLAISRWIARAHGGDIRAESEPEKGARFIVTLPLASEQAHAAAARPR